MKHLEQIFTPASFLILLTLSFSCYQGTDNTQGTYASDIPGVKNVPAQPSEENWKFIEDLKSPMWTTHAWETTTPGSDQADLSEGVHVIEGFSDSKGLLETAYDDLRLFFAAGAYS